MNESTKHGDDAPSLASKLVEADPSKARAARPNAAPQSSALVQRAKRGADAAWSDAAAAPRPSGPRALIGGVAAIAAAGPALFFAPFAAALLAIYSAPWWATALVAIGVAWLAATASSALSRPTQARAFAAAALPLAAAATLLVWITDGALSPLAPWPFAALAIVAFLGGRGGAFFAALLALGLGAVIWLAPDPPVRVIGFAPRDERALMTLLSFVLASLSTAAAAWAAIGAWADALPPLRHPTIARERALLALSRESQVCALRLFADSDRVDAVGAADAALDLPAADIEGLTLAGLAHGDDLGPLGERIKAARAAKETGAPIKGDPFTVRVRTRLGGYRWVEAVVRDGAQLPKPPRAGFGASDVALLIRARWRAGFDDAAEPAADDGRAFLAQMNSALKKTASNVSGYTEILKNELFGPLGSERYRDYARRAHSSSSRLIELLEELFDLAEIEAGRAGAATELVDPVPIVDGALRLVRARAEEEGVSLHADIPPSTPHLEADRGALRRLLVSLLRDALAAASVGDEITLRASLEGDVVQFAVLRTARQRAAAALSEAEGDSAEGSLRELNETADADLGEAEDAAQLARLVARSLVERLGGSLVFAADSAAAPSGAGAVVHAEALLPTRPVKAVEEPEPKRAKSAEAPDPAKAGDAPEPQNRPLTEEEAIDSPLFEAERD